PNSIEKPSRQYCFADFTLDLDRGFLRRGAEEVTLRPKAFEVLAYLVECHGRLVTKAALIEAVWPDTSITDNSLRQSLLEFGRALNDNSKQWIRTVGGRGYVFGAPVTTPIVEFPRQTVVMQAEPDPLKPISGSAPRNLLNRKLAIGSVVLTLAAGSVLLPL